MPDPAEKNENQEAQDGEKAPTVEDTVKSFNEKFEEFKENAVTRDDIENIIRDNMQTHQTQEEPKTEPEKKEADAKDKQEPAKTEQKPRTESSRKPWESAPANAVTVSAEEYKVFEALSGDRQLAAEVAKKVTTRTGGGEAKLSELIGASHILRQDGVDIKPVLEKIASGEVKIKDLSPRQLIKTLEGSAGAKDDKKEGGEMKQGDTPDGSEKDQFKPTETAEETHKRIALQFGGEDMLKRNMRSITIPESQKSDENKRLDKAWRDNLVERYRQAMPN